MSFMTPAALILLLTLPVLIYIGWPRYQFRRTRDITSLILRVIIVLLLIFALAGAQLVRSVDKLAVVFLVDLSDSMGVELREAQLEYIRSTIENKPVDDEWAIVAFGANASPQSDFTNLSSLGDIDVSVAPTHTNIASAIQMAISMFPADATRRIVILSDGQETLGDAATKAQLAAASGIEISYVHFAREPSPDVRITNLEAPNRVIEGQEFDISVTIESEQKTSALLRVFSGGNLIREKMVNLEVGTNTDTFSQTSNTNGFLSFAAQIEPADSNDSFNQNNRLSAFSQVIGPPSVLVIAADETEIESLVPALQEAGTNVTVNTPQSMPLDLSGLINYKSIILANVPATALSNSQMVLIDRYVRDLGGGLVFVGGPQSYGPGGYFKTPLERTLPVETQIRDQQRIPQLTIAYLIDSSGSMGSAGTSGIPNIELAKEAIIRSIDFLQPTDRGGVATFDTGGSWVAPFQQIEARALLQRQVATLRPGGGTDIMAGMNLVSRDIVNEESQRKHIILLTDGGASPSGLLEIARTLYDEHEVTTSVIAIGRSAAQFLEPMSQAGGGKFHRVIDPETIPDIFALETVLATRSYILEEPFIPVAGTNSPILSGLSAPPTLNGYIATTLKTAAQPILRTPDAFADPILAAWQYGLGRAVAFTSDATSRWGANWLQWGDYATFWNQVVNWSITENTGSPLESRVMLDGDHAHIIVDARDDNGAFINGLDLNVSLVAPDKPGKLIKLQQVAPGQYETTFIPDDEGAYYIAVSGQGMVNDTPTNFNQVDGWVMSYSPEYNLQTQNISDRLLAKLAEITDGQSLADTPEIVFQHNLEERTAAAPIWPYLLIAALVMLPLDIAVRRLIITRSDIQRLRAFISGGTRILEERTEQISTLREARDRVRQRSDLQGSAATIAALRDRKTTRESPAESQPEGPRYQPQKPSRAAAASTERQKPEPPEDNIGARLLKRKRQPDDE